jgi:hypothetical protein
MDKLRLLLLQRGEQHQLEITRNSRCEEKEEWGIEMKNDFSILFDCVGLLLLLLHFLSLCKHKYRLHFPPFIIVICSEHLLFNFVIFISLRSALCMCIANSLVFPRSCKT